MRNKNHRVRNLIIGTAFLFVVLLFSPTLGAKSTPNTEGRALAQIDQSPDQVMTWTVLRHRGFNDNFGCWILQLKNESDTADFCAKDKADYDSAKDGSQYQTKGGWLDNLTQHANSDHT